MVVWLVFGFFLGLLIGGPIVFCMGAGLEVRAKVFSGVGFADVGLALSRGSS